MFPVLLSASKKSKSKVTLNLFARNQGKFNRRKSFFLRQITRISTWKQTPRKP